MLAKTGACSFWQLYLWPLVTKDRLILSGKGLAMKNQNQDPTIATESALRAADHDELKHRCVILILRHGYGI